MSPRAACRLATLGFDQVYDYVPGKVDWLARGLPREGENANERRAIDAARDDVVTVRMDERMGDVRPRVEASPYGFAFVVAEGGAVLGRLRKAALEGDPDARAEDVMDPGPSTVRAHMPLDTLRNRLEKRNLTTAVVTTPEGALLGAVRRADLGA
jgi:Mg/Co/Ni transporter MgtE